MLQFGRGRAAIVVEYQLLAHCIIPYEVNHILIDGFVCFRVQRGIIGCVVICVVICGHCQAWFLHEMSKL